jgi:hypothetical protein
MSYHTGSFRIYNPPPGNTVRATNRTSGSAIEDASVEADATPTRSTPQNRDYGWGIICRADVGLKNLYQLEIYADGSPTIWKVEDGNLKQLGRGSPRDVFRGGAATNRLRADCLGSTLTRYVNDRKVLEVTADSEFESGLIGLYVSDSHNGEGVDVLFLNFVVTGPQPKGLT